MNKKVLILGQEGYIGTALTFRLRKHGYLVKGIDNDLRENNVKRIGSESLIKKSKVGALPMTVLSHSLVDLMKQFQPDAIVHLAEQPSAPFSMSSAKRACDTQHNNVVGTLNVLWAMRQACPKAHLIKLGTEGEYPDWLWDRKHIPEGNRMKVYHKKLKEVSAMSDGSIERGMEFEQWEIPTPRYAGSWYHFSKLHDSMNIDYACKIWGLRATDVNQGIVYGHVDGTRLDYDQYFGTVVNRFVVQAVAGMPLTIYGEGEQTRGFIALENSIDAIRLLIDNPPKDGELRVIHQTTSEASVNLIADMVKENIKCTVQHIENPRAEMDKNRFTFDTTTLDNLGLVPVSMDKTIAKLVQTVKTRKGHIKNDVIKPTTKWK